MNDATWLPEAAVALVAGISGAIGWVLKDRVEARRTREQRLHEERAQLYSQILEPILAPFTEKDPAAAAAAAATMNTAQYRRIAFQLSLLGPDAVIRAWNDFMQFMYHSDFENVGAHLPTALRRLGRVLLEIRRSLGNQDTALQELDMLRWLMKDIDAIEEDTSHV